jgi:hypothetical protein
MHYRFEYRPFSALIKGLVTSVRDIKRSAIQLYQSSLGHPKQHEQNA